MERTTHKTEQCWHCYHERKKKAALKKHVPQFLQHISHRLSATVANSGFRGEKPATKSELEYGPKLVR